MLNFGYIGKRGYFCHPLEHIKANYNITRNLILCFLVTSRTYFNTKPKRTDLN